MKLYRIYTEALNQAKIKDILDAAFDSYTVFKTKGCWKGKLENSLVIEIYHPEDDLLVNTVILKIKKLNKQQAVLAAKLNAKGGLV